MEHGRISFSVEPTAEREPRLNFFWQHGWDIRLNTYSDSIEPLGVPWLLNLERFSGAMIQATARSKETHSSQPKGYPFQNKKGGSPTRSESSFLGLLTCLWGGCSKNHSAVM